MIHPGKIKSGVNHVFACASIRSDVFLNKGIHVQGTLRKQKCGYQWMRVGHAAARFTIVIMLVSLAAMIVLALWVYREIPETEWHLIYFLAVYFVAALVYANLGVWLHEQLHCLAFRGTVHEKRTHIVYERKYLLALSGHYRVTGAIDYRILVRALLDPLILVVSLLVVGWLGSFMLPGWWLPLLVTMAVAGVLDMTHDFYWVSQIRLIGEKGKYWDTGRELEVVWKE